MGYDVAKIQKKIAEYKKAAILTRAKLHQLRVQFHTVKRVTSFNAPYISLPLTQFLAMVENILPHDKFVLFKALFRYPIKTNEITDVCFDKLSRIFDGRNPAFNYQFINSAQRDDWEQYRLTKLDEPKVWSTKGWEFFKSEINSVLIVDVPREQKTELPEPYFYWLPINDVITYEADPTTGQMEFIVFRTMKHTVFGTTKNTPDGLTVRQRSKPRTIWVIARHVSFGMNPFRWTNRTLRRPRCPANLNRWIGSNFSTFPSVNWI